MRTTQKLKYCVSILVLFSLVSCSSTVFASEHNRASVHHIVICWLKEPGNLAHRQKLIAETKKLRSIAGVLSVEVGNMLPSDRPIVDSSYDIGIIMTFSDEKAMQDYLLNPQHQKATKEVLAPLTSRVIVYDFVKSE